VKEVFRVPSVSSSILSVETLHHHGTIDVSRGQESAEMVVVQIPRVSDAGPALTVFGSMVDTLTSYLRHAIKDATWALNWLIQHSGSEP